MNRITGIALAALVVLDQTASAQSNNPSNRIVKSAFLAVQQTASAQGICKDARGNFFEFWGGGGDSPGTIRNAGWLNGTTLVVFTSAGFPTPVPTQWSYTGAFTITTGKGQLKGTRTFLTDLGSGWSMDMTIIDPNASTGIFAGATGVIYVNQSESNTAPPPTSYVSEVNGRVCFVRGNHPLD